MPIWNAGWEYRARCSDGTCASAGAMITGVVAEMIFRIGFSESANKIQ
jgi:hypothetical protein